MGNKDKDDKIKSQQDVKDAIAQKFFENATSGKDADNDDMIEELLKWRREHE